MKKLIIALLVLLPLGAALLLYLQSDADVRGSRYAAGPNQQGTPALAEAGAELNAASQASNPASAATATTTGSTRSVVSSESETEAFGDWAYTNGKERVVRIPGLSTAPADEVVELLVFEKHRRSFQFIGDGGVLADLRNGDTISKLLARVPVDAEGVGTIAIPDELDSVFVGLAGRYLLTPETVEVEADPAEFLLATTLGGILRVTFSLPTAQRSALGTGEDLTAEVQRDRSTFSMSEQTSLDAIHAEASSNADGVIEFLSMPAMKQLELIARHPTLAATSTKGFEVTAGEIFELKLELAPGALLAGRVQLPDLTPVEGAYVVASAEGIWGYAGTTLVDTTTDAEGNFSLPNLPPGSVLVNAQKDGFLETGSKTFNLARLESVEHTFTLDPGNSISGFVKFPDGSPAPKVEVQVRFDPAAMMGMGAMNAARGARGDGETDEAGAFSVKGLGKGPFVVIVESEEPDGPKYWTAKSGVKPGTRDLILNLAPMPRLDGRVIDTAGAPVTSFRLHASLVMASPFIPGPSETETYEDAEGRFTTEELFEGEWRLTVTATGFSKSEPFEVELPTAAGSDPVVLVLARAASLAGTVYDPFGAPLSGAKVTLPLSGADLVARRQGSIQTPTATTIEDGTFVLEGLASGEVSVHAQHANFADSEPLIVALEEGGLVEGASLSVRVGATLTGEVFNKDGEAHANGSVYLQDMTTFDGRMIELDANGRFEEKALNPGNINVTAIFGSINPGNGTDNDASSSTQSMMENMRFGTAELKDGETTHMVLGAPPADPVRVSVRVTHADGVPPEGSVITFMQENTTGWESLKMSTLDAKGRTEVTVDEPGPYMVQFQHNAVDSGAFTQNTLEFWREIPKAEEHSIRLVLPVGKISGRVRGPDGKPASSTRVTLTPGGGTRLGTFSGGQYAETTTDADGNYFFDYLNAGTYRVSAGGSMMFMDMPHVLARKVIEEVTVEAGLALDGLDFRLTEAGSISGRVLDLAGKPVGRASIFVEDETGSWVDALSMVASSADGRFTIQGIPPGQVTVFARAKGLASEGINAVVVSGAKAEVDVVIDTGTDLMIRALGGDGEPVKATIRVVGPGGQTFHGLLALEEIMSAQRSWSTTEQRVGPLPPGKYTVFAELPDGRSAKRTVTLTGKPKRVLKLRLR